MLVWTCLEHYGNNGEMEDLNWSVQYNAILTETEETEHFREIGTEVTMKETQTTQIYFHYTGLYF